MNMTISGLQCKVAYWPAMTLGGAAQVAAANCPNKRTLDPVKLSTFANCKIDIIERPDVQETVSEH